jgi:4-hydroxythreonine-4-phosphate dehydrogenase
MIVISSGCPSGIGPEVSIAAAARVKSPCLVVGDWETLRAAARVVGVKDDRVVLFGNSTRRGTISVFHVSPPLQKKDRTPGRPSRAAGMAQLQYVATGYDLVKAGVGNALVTGPVSKHAIATSGAPRFRGHTEWLAEVDGADHAIMCFASPQLVTSLVTTHLPLAKVPRALTPKNVSLATIELAKLLHALGKKSPRILVTSLNPHAGEGELLGSEEVRAIAPGIRLAQRALGTRARIAGPTGAETAYRRAYAKSVDGVVAMYHDQATIPTKLVAFGDAVNVTLGLGIVRTSVDHGTGYDIAWQGKADALGMVRAIELAERLVAGARRLRSVG